MNKSLSYAKNLAIHSQLLDDQHDISSGARGVGEVIEMLGYIQIDTISVIQRAHHHTLWTRLPDYQPDFLHELQADLKAIFEYWGHAASYLSMSDYRYTLPLKQSYADPKRKWVKNRHEKYKHLYEPILERIRQEGALGSKDFKPQKGKKREGWWDWKPAKIALELLFWRGDLMIKERQNFHRIYDLTERVLPERVDTSVPGDEEMGRFLVYRTLFAHGIACERLIIDHLRLASNRKSIIKLALKNMLKSGEVVHITLEDDEKTDYYALSHVLKSFTEPDSLTSLHILSPFDNFVINRDRIKRLFGFDFALECYVPKAKRKYGYFSLPILWGDTFVARMDSKADRKRNVFIVRNLVFEPEFRKFEAFLTPFSDKLNAFVQFNGCESIEIESVNPPEFKKMLASFIS